MSCQAGIDSMEPLAMLGNMARRLEKGILLFGGAVSVLLVVCLAWVLLRSGPAVTPLPVPNGYDNFVKAGQMLKGDFSEYRDWGLEPLRSALSTNQQSLTLIRAGLGQQSRVPLDYSQNLSVHFTELPALKKCALALAADARLAELEHRPTEAARIGNEGVRLAHEAMRGGVIIDALVGMAMESIAFQGLEKLTPQLDAVTCKQLAAALEEIDQARERPEEIIQQEHLWRNRTYGLRGEFAALLNFRSLRQTEQGLVTRIRAQQIRIRVLMLNLASRAYQLEKEQAPQTFADLVPEYLKSIPQDPRTGTNMLLGL